MNKKEKSIVLCVCLFLFDALLAVIAFNYATELKDHWTYSYDKEAQGMYVLHIFIALVFGISAILSLIGAFSSKAETCDNGASEDSYLKIICPNCKNRLEKKSRFCNNCGKNIENATLISSNNNNISSSQSDAHKLETDSTDMVDCIFCSKKIAKDQILCDHCGRRQD